MHRRLPILVENLQFINVNQAEGISGGAARHLGIRTTRVSTGLRLSC